MRKRTGAGKGQGAFLEFRRLLQRHEIAARADAFDGRDGTHFDIGDMPERLARRRIREMDLPERPLNSEKRVAQGNRRMRQPAGVDDRRVEVALVEPVDQAWAANRPARCSSAT